jgi:cytochrome c
MKKVVLFAALGLVAATGSALADGDAAAGEKSFAVCKACHMIGPGAQNRVGPELNGIDGRKQASVETFKGYGADLKGMGEKGGVWNAAELDKYLTNPKEYNPGTKMAFAGLKDAAVRANVIAYITSFGADGAKK